MIYLTKEELVKNIAEQTERVSAIIGHTDFNLPDLNPNSVIIPFLGNIFDSALIVMALECGGDDCHRNALRIVTEFHGTKETTKNFINQIQRTRQKYLDGDCGSFDSDECLDFLNAYDCFMFDFIKNSETVREFGKPEFSSLRNTVEKLLRVRPVEEKKNSNDDLLSLIRKNNELLALLLEETKRINEQIEKLIQN